jgi:hypothetical protein
METATVTNVTPLRSRDVTNAIRQKRFRSRKRNATVTLTGVEVARIAGLLSSGHVTPAEAAFAGHVMLRLVRMLPKSVTVPVG